MPDPRVSVVIPTLNRHGILCETVRYFLAREYEGYEVLVIDQTESQNEKLLSLVTSHADLIRYYTTPTVGLPHARNLGAAKARGEIIIYVDDDVIPVPDFVMAHAVNFADPSVGMVAGRILEPGKSVKRREPVFSISPFGKGTANWTFPDRTIALAAPGGNMSVRKELIAAAGGFEERLVGNAQYEDIDFCFRVHRLGYHIVFDPRAQVVHLMYPTGGCGNRQRDHQWYRDHLYNMTFFFWKNMPKIYFPLFVARCVVVAAKFAFIRARNPRAFPYIIGGIQDALKRLQTS